MQIRYLDTMQAVSKNAGTKVIFMPSADQVERIAMSNMQDQPPSGKGKPLDLEEDKDWVGTPQSIGINNNRHISETVALQEAMRV